MISLYNNNIIDNEKAQLKITLDRYHKILQKYKDIIDNAKHTVTRELTSASEASPKPKSCGRPKKQYTEEEIETLKQKNEILQKDIIKIIWEKIKFQKSEWVKNTRESVNEKAKIYIAKIKLQKEMVLECV